MVLRQCYAHAEKFWTIARRWPTGNQLAAVSDVRTSGSCVGSMYLCLLYEFLVSNILSQPGAMHL